MPFQEFGRWFILIGLFFLAFGFLFLLIGRVPGLGRLPGDILIQKGNFVFFFPLATSILLSLLLTLVLNLVFRLWR
ncbi:MULTISPECIES: DUF2905 domain-containing protein [Thermoflexus]|jgi:hypothetical protein|uniref:DUF2905 domain-containing protein n=1 Tax=Thermoflexus hugenholtzii JAD2 TaxID=877466 RepID=A0A212RUH9_9CHLR|nr:MULTISPECIES: DUF2905 domain-containing protein [Thermoflexus]SNB76221.1 Protein of unknown function [Thermoflexus hugenholtzii JAD2]